MLKNCILCTQHTAGVLLQLSKALLVEEHLYGSNLQNRDNKEMAERISKRYREGPSVDNSTFGERAEPPRNVTAVVTPHVKRQRIQPSGYCIERSANGYCNCFKARLRQRCQSCNSPIEKDHCIFNAGGGWVHRLCPGDENRGYASIFESFNTSVLRIESGTIDIRRRLEFDDKRHSQDDEEAEATDLRKQGEDEATAADIESKHGTSSQAIVSPEVLRSSVEDDDSTVDAKLVKRALDFESEHTDGDDTSPLTQEQRAILDYDASPGDLICVNALAGCGKTTTIALLCGKFFEEYQQGLQMLYVVFGVKARDEARASRKFPKGGMQINTSHAIVRKLYFGRNFTCCVPINALNLDDIISELRLETIVAEKFSTLSASRQERRTKTIAGYIRRTVANFQSTADQKVKQYHVYWLATKPSISKHTRWRVSFGAERYVQWAQIVFDLQLKTCREIREHGIERTIPHDTYMKVAQLEGLRFPHQVILVDEAQDMTPCQADLFWGRNEERQDKVVYLFGDQWQQLYRFRGASDSFARQFMSVDTVKLTLTGSFRFGKIIAKAASLVLQFAGGKQVVGLSTVPGRYFSTIERPMNKGFVICRSNNGMMGYLLRHGSKIKRWRFLNGKGRVLRPNKRICNLEKFLWNDVESFTLNGEKFKDVDELREYCQESDDSEFQREIDLVALLMSEDPPVRVEEFFSRIRRTYVDIDKGDPVEGFDGLVLTTCHGAKGLEFDDVYIHWDFSFEALMETPDYLSKPRLVDEVNAIYVAVTRAKKNLYLSEAATRFIEYLKRKQYVNTDKSTEVRRRRWEEQWSRFSKSNISITCINDIPWPTGPSNNPFLLNSEMTESNQLDYLRQMLLRFHSDKFMPKFGPRFDSECRETLEPVVLDKMNTVFAKAKELQNVIRLLNSIRE